MEAEGPDVAFRWNNAAGEGREAGACRGGQTKRRPITGYTVTSRPSRHRVSRYPVDCLVSNTTNANAQNCTRPQSPFYSPINTREMLKRSSAGARLSAGSCVSTSCQPKAAVRQASPPKISVSSMGALRGIRIPGP